MKQTLFTLLFIAVLCSKTSGQDHGFKFGQFSYKELSMKVYDLDTTANAVVLNEFGEAYVESGGNQNLIFEYHTKIKILKPDGLDEGDFEIPLFRRGEDGEALISIEASTFTLVNGSAVETKFDKKDLINDKITKNWTYKKIALSNVQVGSVIEIKYRTESPFLFKFHPWEFQTHIPKIKSEYWATIPANYVYNITLRGFLSLSLNESTVINNCFTPGGNAADCIRSKFGMENIPAFKKEEYMTAPSNYISAVNFELAMIKRFDGSTVKYTEEWKDVEEKLRRYEKFGVQLKRGKDVVDDQIELLLLAETDPLAKAKKIYDFIKGWYLWDEVYSMETEFGIRKAFENKKGNVGDINLSLIAALKYAKLDAEPMILSTRANGFPIEIHPVLTDFNYVVAKLNIGEKVYLLDATEDAYPFGVLPIRCLNGKGRVLNDKESYWYEIKPIEKRKKISMLNLTLTNDGVLRGTINNTYLGYAAIEKRQQITSFSNEKEYVTDFDNKWSRGTVMSYAFSNVEDVNKAITEKLEVEIEGFDNIKATTLFFNPFIMEGIEKNPFKSNERLYPVDYGVPQEDIMILTIDLPETIEITEVPAKIGLSLPNNGGRFIYDVQVNGNRVVVNCSFSILRSIFTSEEYHYLKELYGRIIQVQNADLVFKPK